MHQNYCRWFNMGKWVELEQPCELDYDEYNLLIG